MINEKNADQPAFYQGSYGLTKREYFAAMAMQGMIAFHGTTIKVEPLCGFAVLYADALLIELEKSQS